MTVCMEKESNASKDAELDIGKAETTRVVGLFEIKYSVLLVVG